MPKKSYGKPLPPKKNDGLVGSSSPNARTNTSECFMVCHSGVFY